MHETPPSRGNVVSIQESTVGEWFIRSKKFANQRMGNEKDYLYISTKRGNTKGGMRERKNLTITHLKFWDLLEEP